MYVAIEPRVVPPSTISPLVGGGKVPQSNNGADRGRRGEGIEKVILHIMMKDTVCGNDIDM